MPAKMISEMPLPMPRSVICSPSHMMNAVPEVSVIIAITRNAQPGLTTAPSPNWPFSSAIAMQQALEQREHDGRRSAVTA